MLLTLLGFSLMSCLEKESLSEDFIVKLNESDEVLTLSKLKTIATGTFKKVSNDYTPTKDWSNTNVYIYSEGTESAEKAEIYVFSDYSDYVQARAECDRNYYKNEETKQMCCDGEGSACSVEVTTTGVEVTVCPVM